MNLRGELLATLAGMAFLNLVLAFGAIGLFVRMGPAIEKIIEENVYSIMATEEILVELSKADGPLDATARNTVEEALDKVERNLTEGEERPILNALRDLWPQVVEGDADKKSLFVQRARELILVNRQAMKGVDEGAQRLGRAGAWAAVFTGFLSFVLTLFIAARLQRRFVQPLIDIHAVLEDAREGQPLRRCQGGMEGPREVLDVARAVNDLLDERLATGTKGHDF